MASISRLPPSALSAVFYVSRSQVAASLIDGIVGKSRATNLRLSLTGGMLYTGNYFAQILEGPTEILLSKMAEIAEDPRHSNVRRLTGGAIESREYERWSMGYVVVPGADQLIEPLLTGDLQDEVADRLQSMVREFISRSQ